jgi:formiminotetrahydrofolate cyclodeaminase
MDTSHSIKHYLDELSSESPTPGGGNVSAFCGTLASSLGIMVCNLTFGKKKYLDSEEELKKIKEELEGAREDFLTLALEDNKAFEHVMEAFKLPKETEGQKSIRAHIIEDATIAAGFIPFRVISLCKVILPSLMTIADKGNQNSLSDAGVALSLISTAAQGAYFNVLINCSSFKTNPRAEDILIKAGSESSAIKEMVTRALELIEKKLGRS